MPRGTHHELTGILLEARGAPVLRVDDGGEWRLDIGKRYRDLLGLRVQVTGKRSGFDLLDVERIDRA